MIRNLIKIAFRNILRNKAYALTNVLGLSIGLSAAIVIFNIVQYNLSFDRHHENTDLIYRLVQEDRGNGNLRFEPGTPYPMRLSIKDDFPEIEEFVMVDQNSGSLITITRNGQRLKFNETDKYLACVTPSFFNVFNRTFLIGNAHSIDEPNTVILSRDLAEKYFGSYEQAIGEVLRFENFVDLTITGVIENPVETSDVPHEMLIAFETAAEARIWDSWSSTSTSVQSFIKIYPEADPVALQQKIQDYIQEKKENQVNKSTLIMQPLREMHFDERYATLTGRIFTYNEIWAFSIIAFLLITTSSINFINLNTALAIKRSKEIGIRKVLGSRKRRIILQMLLETALITAVSLVISLGLAELAYFHLSEWIGYEIPPFAYTPVFMGFLVLLLVAVTLLSGSYPAYIISSFQPVRVLKNSPSSVKIGNLSLRKSLIVFQLLVSQLLIILVIVVHQQLNHFKSIPYGFNADSVIEFSIPNTDNFDYRGFREKILALSGVNNVSFSNTGTASDNNWGGTVTFTRDNEQVSDRFEAKIADRNYLDLYQIGLQTGRFVKEDTIRGFVLNQRALSVLGIEKMEDALGRKFSIWGNEGEVIGVLDDFKVMSHYSDQQPMALWFEPKYFYQCAVKLNTSDVSATMDMIRAEWENVFPEYIFNYQFLDERLERFYANEEKLAQMFTLFTLLAVGLGAIGLLGLISYVVGIRLKEIGIRKVLGARIVDIVNLLVKDLMVMTVLAFMMAAPLAWLMSSMWLQEFASRINLGAGIFILALVGSVLIVAIVISTNTIKAALMNPASILKDE